MGRTPPANRARAPGMTDALQLLLSLDEDAIRATSALRWEPATAILTLLSAWWVKGPLLVAAGWCADLRCKRAFPLVALAATVSFFVASGLNALIKDLVDRTGRRCRWTSKRSSALPGVAVVPVRPRDVGVRRRRGDRGAGAADALAGARRGRRDRVLARLPRRALLDRRARRRGARPRRSASASPCSRGARPRVRRSPARARPLPPPSERPARAPAAAAARRAAGRRWRARPASRRSRRSRRRAGSARRT